MATSSATFPSLLPRVADNLWFTLEKKSDDDAVLTKEEEEYTASLKRIADKGFDIPPVGTTKTKDRQERLDEDDDEIEDDDDSAEEIEDETDEYESPDAESVEGEVEMESSLI